MAIIIEGADGTQIKVAGRGKAGQSPYEAAVAGGYQGTEEEFNQILADAATKTELATKQDKLTGTQGQVVGFDGSGNAVAQAAPQTGMTQDQADERYLQLTGGTISGDLTISGDFQVNGTSSYISGVGLGTIEFGSSITLAGVVNDTPNKPIGFGVLDDSGNIGAGLLIAHVEESSEPDSFMFLTKKRRGCV